MFHTLFLISPTSSSFGSSRSKAVRKYILGGELYVLKNVFHSFHSKGSVGMSTWFQSDQLLVIKTCRKILDKVKRGLE
jgi:hypothetical protein